MAGERGNEEIKEGTKKKKTKLRQGFSSVVIRILAFLKCVKVGFFNLSETLRRYFSYVFLLLFFPPAAFHHLSKAIHVFF